MRRVFAEAPESDASTPLRRRKWGPPSVPAKFLVMVGALASLGREPTPGAFGFFSSMLRGGRT